MELKKLLTVAEISVLLAMTLCFAEMACRMDMRPA